LFFKNVERSREMTENEQTRRLIYGLKMLLPEAVIIKHTDMFTKGVPDFSVTEDGKTTWWEAKVIDAQAGEDVILRPKRDVDAVQWETLRRLKCGYLIIYTPSGDAAMIHVNQKRASLVSVKLKLAALGDLAERIAYLVRES
jgi:hypothetical protein